MTIIFLCIGIALIALNINKLKYYADELNYFTKNIYMENKEVALELQMANKNPVQI